MAPTEPDPNLLARRARRFFDLIPHGQVLGLELIEAGPDAFVVKLPYRAEIVGNPYTSYIHSGALTALIDQASGAAVMLSLPEQESVATLDLRVDHLRPAAPGRDIYARAECYRMAREVAFVRCVCYEDDPSNPVATSMSTFMRTGGRRDTQSPGAEEPGHG